MTKNAFGKYIYTPNWGTPFPLLFVSSETYNY